MKISIFILIISVLVSTSIASSQEQNKINVKTSFNKPTTLYTFGDIYLSVNLTTGKPITINSISNEFGGVDGVVGYKDEDTIILMVDDLLNGTYVCDFNVKNEVFSSPSKYFVSDNITTIVIIQPCIYDPVNNIGYQMGATNVNQYSALLSYNFNNGDFGAVSLPIEADGNCLPVYTMNTDINQIAALLTDPTSNLTYLVTLLPASNRFTSSFELTGVDTSLYAYNALYLYNGNYYAIILSHTGYGVIEISTSGVVTNQYSFDSVFSSTLSPFVQYGDYIVFITPTDSNSTNIQYSFFNLYTFKLESQFVAPNIYDNNQQFVFYAN